ncbi:hypothetical protein [Streptomyces californicus]|uniref:hypothetical protein n=1 Tax=Streptomyces californicus TaxID=67351 RepID=UPI00296F254F|nr:hypothetical protein [Streptomyces californicus]MDW4918684.1 hypothetical protein [Streptomyces californicus]
MTTAAVTTAAMTAEATMNRAYDLLEQDGTAPELGPLHQPLADLLAFHLSDDSRHGVLRAPAPENAADPALDAVFRTTGACYSCGDTGVRYDGTGPDGHMWGGEQCCCQHEHCACGACGGFPCDEVDYVVHLATVLLREHGPHDAAHLAAVPSVEHANQRYLIGYPYADRDGEQWEVLDSTAHDGAPLVILLPAGAGEAARLEDILDEGPLRRIAHAGISLPSPAEELRYWGPKSWAGPVARCSGMRHLAPLGDDGLMDTHTISAGFTGRCLGAGKPPRATPWSK